MKSTALIAAIVAFLIPINVLHAQVSEKPDYLMYFDPKGFKPAQANLTDVFLQMAASLEYYGSPVPYLQHTKAEHERIEELYRKKYGREPASHLPAYMTNAYLNQLAENWNLLSPKLGLESFTKNAGSLIRKSIKGSDGKGTILIEIFNQQQTRIFDALVGKAEPVGFETLQAQVFTELALNEEGRKARADEMAGKVALETALSSSEKAEYAFFLSRDYFDKDDMARMNLFYKSGYDKLTEQGKAEMSTRLWSGVRGGTPRSEAIQYASVLQKSTTDLFARLDAGLSPGDAAKVKAVLSGVFIDVGRMAYSEYQAGLSEWALNKQIAAGK